MGSYRWYGKGRHLAHGVAKGLNYLHTHGVIHSDLKTKNILLSRNGADAKIGDVGLARIISSASQTSQDYAFGTFAYAAPELLLGEKCDYKASLDLHEAAMRLCAAVSCLCSRGHLSVIQHAALHNPCCSTQTANLVSRDSNAHAH